MPSVDGAVALSDTAARILGEHDHEINKNEDRHSTFLTKKRTLGTFFFKHVWGSCACRWLDLPSKFGQAAVGTYINVAMVK